MNQPSQVAGHQHEDAWELNWLRVDDIHELYYQQYGKKDGKPSLCLIVRDGHWNYVADTSQSSIFTVVLEVNVARRTRNSSTRSITA